MESITDSTFDFMFRNSSIYEICKASKEKLKVFLLRWLENNYETMTTEQASIVVFYMESCDKMKKMYIGDKHIFLKYPKLFRPWKILVQLELQTNSVSDFILAFIDCPSELGGNNSFVFHFFDDIEELNKNPEIRYEYYPEKILKNPSLERLSHAFRLRMSPHVVGVKKSFINDGLLAVDWTEKLRQISSLPRKIVERCRFLSTTNPVYFALIKNKYVEVIKDMIKSKVIYRSGKSTLIEINHILGNIFSDNLLTMSDEDFYVFASGSERLAYLLGFNIYTLVPTNNDIFTALKEIKENREEYINKRLFTCPPSQNPYISDVEVVNTEDLLGDRITDFYFSDVIFYQKERNMFFFTRGELDGIKSTGWKNPYTKEDLPPSIIVQMKAVLKTERAFNLPKCDIAKNIIDYRDVDNTDDDIVENTSTEEENTGVRYINLNIFGSNIINFISMIGGEGDEI